jgi:exopolyphosphatase / guanosine-5'-triphosphate,3'-diphosphate pyrophosphatase
VEPEKPRVELARSIGTRIGEGLGERGRLGDEPMQRTLDAVSQLARAMRGHYVRMFAIGTSALRRADNGEEFIERVRDVLGVSLRVLSGEEEAAASYRGALTAFDDWRGERVGAIDVGGGSTEYAFGDSAAPEKVISCETGAVRLTEAVPELGGHDGAVGADSLSRAASIAREALRPLADCAAAERLALVGGSATTTAAIVRGRPAPMASQRLTRADLHGTLQRLCSLTLEERKKVVGMKPQRADILPAGIVVLDAALETLGRDEALATTADLLLGYLLQQRDALGQPQRPPGGSKLAKGMHS